jgi:pyruvate/2-oxoglutarate dehydrogenase complex dihydrolipoamide acyltransferase (E2) component
MTVEVLLPKIGFSMLEGEIAEWMVANGALVTKGQSIYSLESDKTTTEIESPADGIITILVETNVVMPVGAVLATIS